MRGKGREGVAWGLALLRLVGCCWGEKWLEAIARRSKCEYFVRDVRGEVMV